VTVIEEEEVVVAQVLKMEYYYWSTVAVVVLVVVTRMSCLRVDGIEALLPLVVQQMGTKAETD
jgi:hypothetical protein